MGAARDWFLPRASEPLYRLREREGPVGLAKQGRWEGEGLTFHRASRDRSPHLPTAPASAAAAGPFLSRKQPEREQGEKLEAGR